jgi:hypothetical protein
MYKSTLIFILMELTELKRYRKRDDPHRREQNHCRKIRMYWKLRVMLPCHIETKNDDAYEEGEEEEEVPGG